MNGKQIILIFSVGWLVFACKPSLDDSLDKAYILAKEEKYKEAIQIYNEVIASNDNIQAAYYNRGHCYFALKQYAKALADFNKVMDIQRHGNFIITYNRDGLDQSIEVRNQVPFFEALHLRAQVKYDMDSIRSSFQDFERCIQNAYEPSNSTVWQGMLYIKMGRKDKACDYFRKARQLAFTDDDKKEADDMLTSYCY